MSRVTHIAEKIDFDVWDTCPSQARDSRYDLFQNPGGPGTNMQVPGTLVSDQVFLIEKLLVVADAREAEVWGDAVLRFDIGAKIMFERPLWAPPDHVEHAKQFVVASPLVRLAMWGWKYEGTIAARQHFRVTLINIPQEVQSPLRVVLRGKLTRDVQ